MFKCQIYQQICSQLKNYTQFPFKNACLQYIASNLLDMLPRQN